jgi:hypothetical protein
MADTTSDRRQLQEIYDSSYTRIMLDASDGRPCLRRCSTSVS